MNSFQKLFFIFIYVFVCLETESVCVCLNQRTACTLSLKGPGRWAIVIVPAQ